MAIERLSPKVRRAALAGAMIVGLAVVDIGYHKVSDFIDDAKTPFVPLKTLKTNYSQYLGKKFWTEGNVQMNGAYQIDHYPIIPKNEKGWYVGLSIDEVNYSVTSFEDSTDSVHMLDLQSNYYFSTRGSRDVYAAYPQGKVKIKGIGEEIDAGEFDIKPLKVVKE